MAHSRPTSIDNRGDASRLAQTATVFIQLLAADLRALAAFEEWSQRHQLKLLVAKYRSKTGTKADQQRFTHALTVGDPADHELFRRVVAEMGLTHRPWVPPALFKCVQTATWNRIAPRHLRRPFSIEIPADRVATLPPGRAPRWGGADIRRHVLWHYRLDIKHPPDPIHELVDEYVIQYAKDAHRGEDAHSVVRNGIEQTKALLDLIVWV